MKMIAFYNNKGGVGKTSTAINIAYTLSRRENRVLLIDFDGQCNSSRFFTDLTNDEIGCERAIVCTDEKPLIKKTRYDNIDIVTSSVKEIKKLKAEKDNQFANDLLAAIMKDGEISDEKRKEILAMLSNSGTKKSDSQIEQNALTEEKNFNDNDSQNTLSEHSDF